MNAGDVLLSSIDRMVIGNYEINAAAELLPPSILQRIDPLAPALDILPSLVLLCGVGVGDGLALEVVSEKVDVISTYPLGRKYHLVSTRSYVPYQSQKFEIGERGKDLICRRESAADFKKIVIE